LESGQAQPGLKWTSLTPCGRGEASSTGPYPGLVRNRDQVSQGVEDGDISDVLP